MWSLSASPENLHFSCVLAQNWKHHITGDGRVSKGEQGWSLILSMDIWTEWSCNNWSDELDRWIIIQTDMRILQPLPVHKSRVKSILYLEVHLELDSDRFHHQRSGKIQRHRLFQVFSWSFNFVVWLSSSTMGAPQIPSLALPSAGPIERNTCSVVHLPNSIWIGFGDGRYKETPAQNEKKQSSGHSVHTEPFASLWSFQLASDLKKSQMPFCASK